MIKIQTWINKVNSNLSVIVNFKYYKFYYKKKNFNYLIILENLLSINDNT